MGKSIKWFRQVGWWVWFRCKPGTSVARSRLFITGVCVSPIYICAQVLMADFFLVVFSLVWLIAGVAVVGALGYKFG